MMDPELLDWKRSGRSGTVVPWIEGLRQVLLRPALSIGILPRGIQRLFAALRRIARSTRGPLAQRFLDDRLRSPSGRCRPWELINRILRLYQSGKNT